MAIETKVNSSDHRVQIVQIAGALTTLAAFALVFAAAKAGTNIMGYYVNWVLPVGALFVGLLAASGYAIAAWFTGLKMTSRMMWSITGQLVLSYFIAQYETYHLHVAPHTSLGFFEWFDLATRAFSFSQRNGEPGSGLGAVGYLFRVLEIAGFVGGGVIVPLGLRSKLYCDTCRTYKRDKAIAVIRGGLYVPHLADGPYADYGLEHLQTIYDGLEKGTRADVETAIAAHGSMKHAKETRKHGTYTSVTLARCPRCAHSTIVSLVTENRGNNNIQITTLPGMELEGERVRELFD